MMAMQDFFFIILFVTGLLAFYFIIKMANLSLLKFNISSFVIISMIVNSYLGILPLYFSWDEIRFDQGVQDQEIILTMFCFSFLSIFLMISGYIIANQVFLLKFNKSIVTCRRLNKPELVMVFLFFLLSLGVLFLYLDKINNIALFSLFSNGIEQAKIDRSNMINNFPGKFHWYKLFIRDLLNFLAFSLFANYLVSKKKLHLLFFMLVFLSAMFTSIMTTEKGHIIWLIIGMFLVYVLTMKNGVYPFKIIFKVGFILIAILVFLYIYMMGSEDVSSALNALFSRAFSGSIMPAYFYIEYFPQKHDFLYGQSFPNPAGIFSFTPYSLAIEMHHYIFSNKENTDVIGSAASVFWVEAYANLGVLGVLLIPMFVAFMIYLLDFIIDKLELTPLKIGFVIWLALHFGNLSISFASKYIFDTYFIGVLIFFLAIMLFANKGKIKFFGN